MTITFTIQGNQNNPKGNPLGYHRTTQRGKWNPASLRYYAWMRYVQKTYIDASGESKNYLLKPIELGTRKAYLNTMIYYASDHRPDPDNVQKGIADALFVNDKNVAGTYDFELASDKVGKVLVTITTPDA